MKWQTQAALAVILAILGVIVVVNPVNVVTAAGSIIPWLLLAGGAVQFISVLLRSRRRFRVVVFPVLIGTLLVYAGLSMKFGDPTTVGPLSLIFVLALLLLGSGGAKVFLARSVRKSKYFNYILGAGILSLVLGLIVLGNWSTVSTGLIGLFIGLEMIADAVVLLASAMRERDGEEALESLGLDPVSEAAKVEAERLAAAAAEAAARVAQTAPVAPAPIAPPPGPVAVVPPPPPAPPPGPPAVTATPPAPPAASPAIDIMQQAQLPGLAPGPTTAPPPTGPIPAANVVPPAASPPAPDTPSEDPFDPSLKS